MKETHIGRSWAGNQLEQDCPCPKAECGLVIASEKFFLNECEQHSGNKTLRQIHDSENCPAKIK